MTAGKIYLIPTPIGETAVYDVTPEGNRNVIASLDYFIVENLRSARRFLAKASPETVIDSLHFVELNEHTPPGGIEAMLAPVLAGRSAGIISEAGVPAIADPGADIVALAHKHGIDVVPLVGPSSIILALMSSGLNGQSFAFNGYLPVKQPERAKAIKFFEARAIRENQPQIFIEAPYRNAKLLDDILSSCNAETMLCIAVDILQSDQYIRTKSIAAWRREKPDINKRPAIFILSRR